MYKTLNISQLLIFVGSTPSCSDGIGPFELENLSHVCRNKKKFGKFAYPEKINRKQYFLQC